MKGVRADPGDCAGNDDGGEVGWAADLLAQVAEGVVGYLRRTFQDHKFRAVASPLRVEIQLISEAHILVTSPRFYFITTPKITSVAAMPCLIMTDVRHG